MPANKDTKTHKILKIGLTGGIGSGKSTVAQYFAELGVPIIDADRIAHELLEQNSSIRNQLVEYFGKNLLDSQQNIDRRKLRAIVFDDPQKLAWLENLLHPLIEKEMLKRSKEIKYPYCIFVIPLLLEKQKEYLVDRVLIVNITQQKQIERAARRDKTADKEVKKIIAVQVNPQQRLTAAHDVINNDGPLEGLRQQVQILHEKYLALANVQI